MKLIHMTRHPTGVTRGLDPRVHLLREKNAFTKEMDGRVKPGHDTECVARYEREPI
jgi:hypothetical protein